MKTIPIKINGMQFRSKLEGRYSGLFKKLNLDFDYEPQVPGLFGYQPDFVIYPKRTKLIDYLGKVKPIYVEIKPIRDVTKIFEDPDYNSFREKIYKNWNRENDLIVFGGKVFGRGQVSAVAICWQNNFSKHYGSYGIHYSLARGSNQQIGLSWNHAELYAKDDHTYPLDGAIGDNEKEAAEYIEQLWNESWSELQWKPEPTLDQKIQRVQTINEMIELVKKTEDPDLLLDIMDEEKYDS
jgi:hypothetical protein